MKTPRMKFEFIDRKKLCSRKELKQEAIKQIDMYKPFDLGFEDKPSPLVRQMRYNEIHKTADWIKKFFNITKGDGNE